MRAARIALAAAAVACGDAAPAQQAEDAGFRLYQQHCRTCHTVREGDHRLGPRLAGIVGRRAGAIEGFAFSPTMRGSTVVWDEGTLDAVLADPPGVMPGHRML